MIPVIVTPKIKWAQYTLPPEAASEHFLFLGSTGSGKSVLIKMLMKSAMDGQNGLKGTRALIYDAKQDIVPTLHGLHLADRIRLLNPFDRRGVAWDIAGDVTSPIIARQIATILVPEAKNSSGGDQFFTAAVRELLMGVMVILMNSPIAKTWTLRDALIPLFSLPQLKALLASSDLFIAKRLQEHYLASEDHRTTSNILTTISTKLGIYEPVAAAWSHAPDKIAIRDWIGSDWILVLGNDEGARASLDAINRALFQRVTEEVLKGAEQPSILKRHGLERTWIILDEVREAGRLEGLRSVLNKGRSKGACVVLGCQDVEGMRSVYGKEEANELLAQCSHVAVLNVINPETARWASELFGEADIEVSGSSEQIGGPFSQSVSEKIERKTLVSTYELLTMPKLNPIHGMSGYLKSPVLERSQALVGYSPRERISSWERAQGDEFSWDKAIKDYLPAVANVPAFEPRDVSQQYLMPWNEEEIRAIGLKPVNSTDHSDSVAPGDLGERPPSND
ncbi:MAG: type IV secretion system DNA-binding domain-containing protein [Armatimonadetes bacterium]|nr:type IV secretion system DNA-binding domain-containing protein [Armatimonadota bacterium]